MKKGEPKRCKTFPLEMEDDLHKALKYKAIEANQTLHAFIIQALAAKVQEEPAKYAASRHHAETATEKKK
jgi:predicted HicB family RNase H-like nuclease